MIKSNFLKQTNIEKVLEKERKNKFNINLEEFLKNLNIKKQNKFNIDLLDKSKIYHLKQIKNICINYRLRFLDLKYFKNKLLKNALYQIKLIEKTHNCSLSRFKVMAPSKLFKLVNTDDPLLFIPIGNDYYYLIHKWGNNLKSLRKLVMWPLKNIRNLFITIFVITLLLTWITPQNLFTKKPSASTFLMLYLFNLKAVMFIFFFYGISMGKNFNKFIWNSKHNKS